MALAERVRGFSQGLHTTVGEFGQQLSGGEARRLCLARILLRDPDLVILNEPLTGLGQASTARVVASLDSFLCNRKALLLGHETAALPNADRVLQLNADGTLSATS